MAIYKENPSKLSLILSAGSTSVTLQFDGFQGTVGSLLYMHNGPKILNVGDNKTIDTSENLKGKTLSFGGALNNPDEEALHLRFTFTESEGNQLIYNFPDDYTGTPVYIDDKEPNYEFKVKFV